MWGRAVGQGSGGLWSRAMGLLPTPGSLQSQRPPSSTPWPWQSHLKRPPRSAAAPAADDPRAQRPTQDPPEGWRMAQLCALCAPGLALPPPAPSWHPPARAELYSSPTH